MVYALLLKSKKNFNVKVGMIFFSGHPAYLYYIDMTNICCSLQKNLAGHITEAGGEYAAQNTSNCFPNTQK